MKFCFCGMRHISRPRGLKRLKYILTGGTYLKPKNFGKRARKLKCRAGTFTRIAAREYIRDEFFTYPSVASTGLAKNYNNEQTFSRVDFLSLFDTT